MKRPSEVRSKQSKIKVFLFAYVNQVGAFNLSARYLAEHLDKSRFEVYTLSLSKGDFEFAEIEGVKVYNCFYPAKVSNYLGIFWGILKCDVAFVLRGNYYKYIKFWLNVLKKPSFKRQGNKIDAEIEGTIASAVGGREHIAASYNFCREVYSPTKLIGNYNEEHWGIKYNKDLFLPPFVNVKGFKYSLRPRTEVRNIVFVGNDMVRKNIAFYTDMARQFKDQSFHVVGHEPEPDFFQKVVESGLKNLHYHGAMDPRELNLFLDNMDLHCFPSKSEGFGKVTIELAAKGIPSLLFDHYGAEEWLTNKKEGMVVHSEEEYQSALSALINDPNLYMSLVEGTKELTKRFSTENQLLKYESIIKHLYHG